MISGPAPGDQPLYDRLWGSGFLPTRYQGVKFRSGRSGAVPVQTPRHERRRAPRYLDDLAQLNELKLLGGRRPGDRHPHRAVRDGLPHADLGAGADRPLRTSRSTSSSCTARTSRKPGTFAANCLLAGGWPSAACASSSSSTAAGTSTPTCRSRSRAVPRYRPALRGAGEGPEAARAARRHAGGLGRRVRPHVYCQGKLTADDYGRDHHPRCFTIWMAGGGVKPGFSHGETDDFCYNIVARPGPRPRPARDDAALPGHRPHEADLQVPGPPLPPDRRARPWSVPFWLKTCRPSRTLRAGCGRRAGARPRLRDAGPVPRRWRRGGAPCRTGRHPYR
jgi:hypothetical protein